MRIKFTCPHCGSEDILKDAWATWDIEKQEWTLHSHYHDYLCNDCEEKFSEPNEEEEK